MTGMRIAVVALAAAALCACGEKPQVAGSGTKKSDTRAYEGGPGTFAAAGWKAGDSGSWEDQMRVRVQNQNEYVRIK